MTFFLFLFLDVSQLRHPNILQFHGACTQSRKQYIVTPYVSLGSLDSILHDTGLTIHGRLIHKMLIDVVKGTVMNGE
jgi:serine/threonine protein kinase